MKYYMWSVDGMTQVEKGWADYVKSEDANEMLSLLESIKGHIDRDSINLESSGYLKDEINSLLEKLGDKK